MKSVKAVTVKDVAKAAGVSQAAVSMALRGSKEISAKRIEQIQAVARKLNYYPQAAGQLLRSKRKNQIGLVVASSNLDAMAHSGFQAPLLGVMAAICYKVQIAYQLEMYRYDEASPSNLPHQIAANMVDGAILIGDMGQKAYDALYQRADFPWVSINEPAPYAVLMDIVGVTEQLLKFVASEGHQRVAYCGGPLRYMEHRLAYETFTRFSAQQQWDQFQKSHWITTFPAGDEVEKTKDLYNWARKFLASNDRPTAVICHGDPQARTVAHVAAGLGLEVGRDLSVTSWGSRVDAVKTWPVMTAVVYDHEQMAHAALKMLQKRMSDPKSFLPQNQIVQASIHHGLSLGPCPKF